MKRCNKSSARSQDHDGAISFYQEMTTSEGTSFVRTCAQCGNTVLRRQTQGEPRPERLPSTDPYASRRKPRSARNQASDGPPLAAYKGLLLIDSYWRWPERDLAGNAIDFFVQFLGLSFNDAMRQITGQ